MTVQQFLISNFRTGLDQQLEPWLLMDDAFVEFENYRSDRGVISPRKGISGFAQGGQGSAQNEQSRIYTDTTGEAVADTNQTFTHTIGNLPVRPGSVTFSEGGGDSATDDGTGGFTGDFDPGATIDYQTGAVSATWTNGAPTNPVVAYTAANGNPVMGIFNFITSSNTRELIVASTDEFNKYNSTTNRFDTMTLTGSGTAVPTGSVTQYFSSTMYPDKTNAPRLIMVNDKVSDRIYVYNGTNINRFQNGGDYGDVSTGAGDWAGNLATALHVFYFNERLVLIRPRTTSKQYPQRICWTGINDGSGNGDDFNAPGSGYLDIPTQFFITAATKLKNAIMIWTTENVWELTVTDDIDLPFRIKQIGDSRARGAQAEFSGVTWFGESAAIGHLGIVGTDGRDAFRIDNKIPDFSRDRMAGLPDSNNNGPFNYITGGTVFEDDQFWWCYPDVNSIKAPDGTDNNSNTNVLAFNFVEESWAVYDLFLTRIGEYQKTANEIPWDDVNGSIKDEWEQWDTTFDLWDSFFSQEFVFLTILGDEKGFIYRIDENMDVAGDITGVTLANPCVINTERDKFKVADKVLISGITGTTELNGNTYEVTAVSGNTITIGVDSSEFTAYSSGGTVLKHIPRSMISKPFNPFVKDNKKCKLKRVHLYFDTGRSSMLMDLRADRREDAWRRDIVVDDGTDNGGAVKKWTSISVNQVAAFHTLRFHRDDLPANERLHAIILECEPVGRLYR